MAKNETGLTPLADRKYPKLEAKLCIGKRALTQSDLKEIMGWTESKPKKGGEPFITIKKGSEEVPVWCTNNTKNRPFGEPWARTLAQDKLNGNWAETHEDDPDWTINGESIVIDWDGQVQSGQHRIMGAIFAEYERTQGDFASHWQKRWPNPITLEALVVYGVSPSIKVTRTLDNVKPRTYADVLFLDPSFFPKAGRAKREAVAKMTDFAVRMLWLRTGCKKDPFAPMRTHSEGIDFLERHPKLKEAVKFIDEANVAVPNSKPAVARYLNPGFCAALLYLMGTSDSDADKYYKAKDPRREKLLSFDHWGKACEFWNMLATMDPALKPVREELATLADVTERGDGSVAEKLCIIVKAWNLFSAGKKVRKDSLEINYNEKSDGSRRLDDYPTVGGVDLGDLSLQRKEDEDDTDTPEEIEERKLVAREQKRDKLMNGRKAKKRDDDEDDEDAEEPDVDEDELLDADDDAVDNDDEDDDVDDMDDDDDTDADEDEDDEEEDEDDDDEPVGRRVIRKPAKVKAGKHRDDDDEDEEDERPVKKQKLIRRK